MALGLLELANPLLKSQLVVAQPLQVLADKLVLLVEVFKVGFEFCDGGLTFGQTVFELLVGLLQLRVLILEVFDDHEQFFDLGLVVADEFEVSVDLSFQRGDVVIAILGHQQVLEVHQRRLIQVAPVTVFTAYQLDVVYDELLDLKVVAVTLHILLQLLHLLLEHLQLFLEGGYLGHEPLLSIVPVFPELGQLLLVELLDLAE